MHGYLNQEVTADSSIWRYPHFVWNSSLSPGKKYKEEINLIWPFEQSSLQVESILLCTWALEGREPHLLRKDYNLNTSKEKKKKRKKTVLQNKWAIFKKHKSLFKENVAGKVLCHLASWEADI
jgi:hypothetical protein